MALPSAVPVQFAVLTLRTEKVTAFISALLSAISLLTQTRP